MTDTNIYDSFAIFPALNVARVGNSDEYYVGSEIPGVYVGGKLRQTIMIVGC
jgi:hypothetical protein